MVKSITCIYSVGLNRLLFGRKLLFAVLFTGCSMLGSSCGHTSKHRASLKTRKIEAGEGVKNVPALAAGKDFCDKPNEEILSF